MKRTLLLFVISAIPALAQIAVPPLFVAQDPSSVVCPNQLLPHQWSLATFTEWYCNGTPGIWTKVNSATATSLAGGSTGQYPYQSAPGVTSYRTPNAANGPLVLDANGNAVVGTTVLGTAGVRRGGNIVTQAGDAWVAPYDTIATGAGNWADGTTSFETVFSSYQYRVRQSGTVKKLRIYTPAGAKTALLTMKLRIWRGLDATSVLVGESDDITASLVEGQTTTITLSSPIAGVQQGDYYGYRQTLNGASSAFQASTLAISGGGGYYAIDTAAKPSGTNWLGGYPILGPYNNSLVPILLFMNPPDSIYIGDSITQGVDNNYAFTQIADGTTFDLSTYWGNQIGVNFSWVYQNMGHGSDTTTQMLARFDADCIAQSPKYCTVEGGINDLIADTPTAAIIANLQTMYAKAFNAGITPIIIPILPCSAANCTNTRMANRDTVNAAIIAAAPTYGAIVATGANNAVGAFRAGGAAGNLWDYAPTYGDAGGYHMTAAGSSVFGTAVIAAISATVAAGTDAARMTPTGITATGGYAGMHVCWKAGGKAQGYGTAAEIAAGICH